MFQGGSGTSFYALSFFNAQFRSLADIQDRYPSLELVRKVWGRNGNRELSTCSWEVTPRAHPGGGCRWSSDEDQRLRAGPRAGPHLEEMRWQQAALGPV
jgi:hypothetical protein